MPGRIVRNARADDDLVEITAYLILEDEPLAMRFLRSAEAACRQLAKFPGMGSRYHSDKPSLAAMRKCPIPGFPNHWIFYRPLAQGIEIVRVLHAARNLGPLLNEDNLD